MVGGRGGGWGVCVKFKLIPDPGDAFFVTDLSCANIISGKRVTNVPCMIMQGNFRTPDTCLS